MSLMSFIGKQFIDVLQWNEEGPGVLAWRYPMQDFEIQNGAALAVRETQRAMFVNEGKVADLFGPGNYTLTTRTLPVLTYLQNWDKFFESPFKSDVFFFSVRDQIDQRWGTPQPITVRDKEFGALRIRANGVYSYRLVDPAAFWTNLSGTVPIYTVDDAAGQLRAAILTSIASTLGSSNVPFIDMAAQQDALSATLKAAVAPALLKYGLELTSFYLQSLSLPGRGAGTPGPRQLHAHRRRSRQIHPVRSGREPADRGREPRRRGGGRRRARGRADDGADDGRRRQSSSAASPRARPRPARHHRTPIRTAEKRRADPS